MVSVVLFYVFCIALQVQGEGGCRDLQYLPCIDDETLTGHVINTIKMIVPALGLCQNKCFQEHKCLSYNLGPVLGQTRSCELNAADHSTRPSFMVNKTGYKYCPIQNPCQSNPCPSGRLCTADLAWNSFNCNDGGWTQWNPWTGSCNFSSNCVRTRSCASPAPQNSGAQCNGESSQTNQCPIIAKNELQGCSSALGMENGNIKDSQIRASSYSGSTSSNAKAPWRARLNKETFSSSHGGWVAGGTRQALIGSWIQIDLESIKTITKVATQGEYNKKRWVSKYSLESSNDTNHWTHYEGPCLKHFAGNNAINTIVYNQLETPIKARYIRLIVQGFQDWSYLRMELYGCS